MQNFVFLLFSGFNVNFLSFPLICLSKIVKIKSFISLSFLWLSEEIKGNPWYNLNGKFRRDRSLGAISILTLVMLMEISLLLNFFVWASFKVFLLNLFESCVFHFEEFFDKFSLLDVKVSDDDLSCGIVEFVSGSSLYGVFLTSLTVRFLIYIL